MVADDENVLRDIAIKHEKSKNYPQALEEYKKLTTLNDSNFFYPYRVGYCLYKMEKFSEAIQFYERSLQTIIKADNPNKHDIASIHLLIGDCYKELKDTEKAKKEYDTYLSIESGPKAKYFYNDRMKLLKKNRGKGTVNNSSPYLKPLVSIILEVVAFVIIAIASFVPLVGFTVTLVSVSASVNASIFTVTTIDSSGTSSTGGYNGANALWPSSSIIISQIIVLLILLSTIILLVLDAMVILYMKKPVIPNFIRHYKGSGLRPSALVTATFVCLVSALYGILVGGLLSNFIVTSSEHIESGLYLFIAGIIIYIIRGFFKTNPNYVKRRTIKKSTIKSS